MPFLLLAPLFLLELYLSLKVGEQIGFWLSALWIVVSAMVGVVLLQRTPYTVAGHMRDMMVGKSDPQRFHNASAAYMVGALLLIVPGVLSDLVGVLSLLYSFYLRSRATMNRSKVHSTYHEGEEDVIDVEVIDSSDDRHSGR